MSFAASRYFEDESSGQKTTFTGDTYLVRYDETLCAVLRGEKCTKHGETLEHLRKTIKRFHREYAVTTGTDLASQNKFVRAREEEPNVYVTVVKKASEYTVLQEAQPVVSAVSHYSAIPSFGYYSEQCDGLPWE